MLTEVEITQTRAPVSYSAQGTSILCMGKECFRYEKTHGENKELGSAHAGALLYYMTLVGVW